MTGVVRWILAACCIGGMLLSLTLMSVWASPTAPDVPPANDSPASPFVIPADGGFPYLAPLIDVADATTLGDPAPSCLTSGQLSNSVWYSFTPDVSQIYRFSTSGSSSLAYFAPAPTSTSLNDTYLVLFDANFNSIACDNDGGAGFQAELEQALVAGTQYYIMVAQWSSSTPPAVVYPRSSVQLYVAPATLSNDTCAAPVALSLNSVVVGTTNDATNDYQTSTSGPWNSADSYGNFSTTSTGRDLVYSFTAPTTDTYSFRLHNTHDTVDISMANPVLYIAETCPAVTGTPLEVAFAVGANRTAERGNAEVTAPYELAEGQTVYVFVDSSDSTTYGFRLEVNQSAVEQEPNGTPAEAAVYEKPLMGGFATGSTDIDFFALTIPQTNSRVFAIADAGGNNSNSMQLRVTTLSDTLEYDSGNNDTPFGSSASNVAGVPVSAGQVYLRLNHGSTSQPYRLFSVVQPPLAQAVVEQEPNDSAATATVGASGYFSGTLAGPAASADRDVYAFEAQAGDTIFASLDANPTRDASPINGRLSLLDDQGNLLFQVNDASGSASNLPGAGQGSLTSSTPNNPAEALLYKVDQAGTYHVLVDIGTTSTTATGAGDYLLSIATFAAEAPTGAAGEFILVPEFNSVNEADGATSVLVQRTNGSSGAASVDLATMDGSAVAGQDYVPLSTTLNFADGETTKSISVTLINDVLPESSEIFTVTLSNPTNGTSLGTSSATTITIADDDGSGATNTPTPGTPTATVITPTPTGDTPTATVITPTPTGDTPTATVITPTPTGDTPTPTTVPAEDYVVYLPLVRK